MVKLTDIQRIKVGDYMKKHKSFIFLTILVVIISMMTGCGGSGTQKPSKGSGITPIEDKTQSAGITTDEGIIFHGVLVSVDEDNKEMIIADIDDGNRYKFTYTGGTDIRNRYKDVIAISQTKVGRIYEFACDESGRAKRMTEWDKYWMSENISRFEMDAENNKISVGNTVYNLSEDAVIMSGDDALFASEIVSVDKISVYGKDKTVYAIIVESGHGYIELKGTDAFLDGYVTYADNVSKVSMNMVITAPEGEYDLVLQKDGQTATKHISLNRGDITTVDFSDYVAPEVKTGSVKLDIQPESAILMVDGVIKDHSKTFNLAYGVHTVTIIADGYDTYSAKMVIGSSYFNKSIELVQQSTQSSTSTTDTSLTDGYVIKINGPSGAAVYIDNAYVGIAPLSINKTAGTKLVTLSKAGYQSTSYNIKITNTAGNVEYTFPELVKLSS